jgi:hypothetical protein
VAHQAPGPPHTPACPIAIPRPGRARRLAPPPDVVRHRRDGRGGEDEVFEQELAGVREHGKARRGSEGDRRGGQKDRDRAGEEQHDLQSDVADRAIGQQEAGRDDLEHPSV